jgi:hypothetical protein
VRQLGLELGLPQEIVMRQPFPGPGLAVRILGEVTPQTLRDSARADTIVVEEMKASGWYYKIWQSFAVLLPVRSVGVMGDERTYDYTIAIRAVESQDGMTADWVKLPYDLLEKLASRIINEVKGVNRACFDISSKPPATIEWEYRVIFDFSFSGAFLVSNRTGFPVPHFRHGGRRLFRDHSICSFFLLLHARPDVRGLVRPLWAVPTAPCAAGCRPRPQSSLSPASVPDLRSDCAAILPPF